MVYVKSLRGCSYYQSPTMLSDKIERCWFQSNLCAEVVALLEIWAEQSRKTNVLELNTIVTSLIGDGIVGARA
ncbi:hypothetical protein DPMN_172017 [Dreissena polymorpha]|uniref:Uncharacterized protein n=1 Tax=Dreissena polymorpha TaxID=45954 RepID=A0A9D4DZ24_DREPO|nr:hypothetical protein DPMN_172017 [Dreissena polymorpha]